MSVQEEQNCPLCTEEMDLTDQQFKPCPCGYKICVWCWHHIMEMAKKDDTEGRCPTCRNIYDEEKILAMTISSERLVELKSGEKQKLKRANSRIKEVPKNFNTIRVIQRNIAYVAGIPVKFANEEILRKKDFFGQYGKITRVDISQGSNDHFHNLRVVYITFSKEEEAIRCIQVVNGYVLDGKPLKASFGATKYCHAWLKNMRCDNPKCVYLHDSGCKEDICTRDEVASACTRKLQQSSGKTLNSLQQRSGTILPPPIDFFCNGSSITNCNSLVQSANNGVNGKKLLHSGDTRNSYARPAAASRGSSITSGRSSSASLTVSQGIIEHPSLTNRSNLSFSDVLAHVPAELQNVDQVNKQTITLRNQMPLSNGSWRNRVPQKPFVENGCTKNAVVLNSNESNMTYTVTDNCASGSSSFVSNDVNSQKIIVSKCGSDLDGPNQGLSISLVNDSIRCFTDDETRMDFSDFFCSATDRINGDSESRDTITYDFLPTVKYSDGLLMQDAAMSKLQSETHGIELQSSSASQNMSVCCDLSSELSDLQSTDATKFICSLSFDNCIPTSIVGGSSNLSSRVVERSTDPAGCIGLSSSQGKSNHEFSTFRENVEYQSDKAVLCRNTVVLDKDVIGSRENSIESDKADLYSGESYKISHNANVNRREYSLVSDTLSHDLHHLIDPDGLAKPYCVSDGGEYYDSWMPCNRNEAKFSFTTVNDSNSRMQQLASPVSRSEASPLSRYLDHVRPTPPGFPPHHSNDQDQKFSKHTNSGSVAQYDLFRNPPCRNSYQEIARNRCYCNFNLSHPASTSIRGNILQSTTPVIAPSCVSKAVSFPEIDQRFRLQAGMGNSTLDSLLSINQSGAFSVQVMSLQGTVEDYQGPWRSHNMGSSTAVEPACPGRQVNSGLTEIIKSLIPGSDQFLRTSRECGEPNLQV